MNTKFNYKLGLELRNTYTNHVMLYSISSSPTQTKKEKEIAKKRYKIWLVKRIILNITWWVLNIIILIAGAVLVATYIPQLTLLWWILVGFYSLICRNVAIIVFDSLIGNGYE